MDEEETLKQQIETVLKDAGVIWGIDEVEYIMREIDEVLPEGAFSTFCSHTNHYADFVIVFIHPEKSDTFWVVRREIKDHKYEVSFKYGSFFDSFPG